MSSTSYQLGRRAEEAALQYLLKQPGWKLVQRHFRGRTGELDLVGREGATWNFIEVKASLRRPPVEALSPRQQQRIRRAAQEFLQSQGESYEVDMRFDVLWLWGEPFQVEHLRDAF